jgi:CubicO group peptidase (beta-lactamase class C family)
MIVSIIAACLATVSGGQVFSQGTNAGIIDAYLTRLAAEKNFCGGVLITKDGNPVLIKGYGWADRERKIPFTPGTLASMGSITKAFTAAAIMKLTEQDKLSVGDPLSKFFPEIPADKASITIHQLLTHSGGFHEFLTEDGGDYAIVGTHDFLKKAFAEPLAFAPGTKAVYTNLGMSILAIIIEQVSGMDYEQYLRKTLFEPIGIKGIGYHYPVLAGDTIAAGYTNGSRWGTLQEHISAAGGGPWWNLKGNGGLEASLNDMLLWTRSINDHSVLKESTVQKMFTPHIQEDGYNGQSWFGYGCNISKSRRNTVMIDNGGSNGVYFARLIRLPEEGVIFYMVTNESSINTNKVLPNVTQLWFQGEITQDALAMEQKFENPMAKKIYDLLLDSQVADLKTELSKKNLVVEDDMVLLEVGQALTRENKLEKAVVLYQYYTAAFPQIVVAWNDLGEIYLMQGKKEDAIPCFEQALKIRPGNPRARENLQKLGK